MLQRGSRSSALKQLQQRCSHISTRAALDDMGNAPGPLMVVPSCETVSESCCAPSAVRSGHIARQLRRLLPRQPRPRSEASRTRTASSPTYMAAMTLSSRLATARAAPCRACRRVTASVLVGNSCCDLIWLHKTQPISVAVEASENMWCYCGCNSFAVVWRLWSQVRSLGTHGHIAACARCCAGCRGARRLAPHEGPGHEGHRLDHRPNEEVGAARPRRRRLPFRP